MAAFRSLATNPSLVSIATRLALGSYPVLLVLELRWVWGKEAYDIAAAAINWASYLNVLLLSGFALVPPAVARLRSTAAVNRTQQFATDRKVVHDHVSLGRWLLAGGLLATIALGLTVDRAFVQLVHQEGASLRWWFLLFAALALSQIPLALWLGVAQAAGKWGVAFTLVALPRAGSLLLIPGIAWAGFGPGVAIVLVVGILILTQTLLGGVARRALRAIDEGSLSGSADARRVLSTNFSAGLVVLIGTAVTILPVSIVGHASPENVGNAHVIVGFANALGAVAVAAFFPRSLALAQRLHVPGGIKSYCMQIARRTVLASILGLLIMAAAAGALCSGLAMACPPAVLWTCALVLIGAGMRLGALGTQHIALYQQRPHLNLISATAEAVTALAVLLLLLSRLGLPALGWGLLAGGALRLVLALSMEIEWLRSS